jgi:hypothetical protein
MITSGEPAKIQKALLVHKNQGYIRTYLVINKLFAILAIRVLQFKIQKKGAIYA